MDWCCFAFGRTHSQFNGYQDVILRIDRQQYRLWLWYRSHNLSCVNKLLNASQRSSSESQCSVGFHFNWYKDLKYCSVSPEGFRTLTVSWDLCSGPWLQYVRVSIGHLVHVECLPSRVILVSGVWGWGEKRHNPVSEAFSTKRYKHTVHVQASVRRSTPI